jgi:hypothetical protein
MKFVLKFTRLFKSGTLKGLTHEDKINFVTWEDADLWVRAINANAGVNYDVVSFSVVARFIPLLQDVE